MMRKGLSVHYCDVIMGVTASQITGLTIVCSTVYSGAYQRKHQSSASLAFVKELPAQMASNAENVSIWWRPHVYKKMNSKLSFAKCLTFVSALLKNSLWPSDYLLQRSVSNLAQVGLLPDGIIKPLPEPTLTNHQWSPVIHPKQLMRDTSSITKISLKFTYLMMTSSNGNIFRVTGHFTGHRWIPRTKASDAELWCFLWSAPEWTIVRLVIWDAIAPIITSQ